MYSGAGVSGSDFGASLFQVRARSGVDAFWSGGNFGPEASVVTLVFGLLSVPHLLYSRSGENALCSEGWLCKE